MPAGPIGAAWVAGSWTATTWEAGSWGLPPVVAIVGLHITSARAGRSPAAVSTQSPSIRVTGRTAGVTRTTQDGQGVNVTVRLAHLTDLDFN